MHNSIEFVALFYGAAKLGLIAVPLNTRLTAAELSSLAVEVDAGPLVEEMKCSVVFWDGRGITVTPAPHVELTVTYTEPGAKGNTAGNVLKPATLSNGVEINVPAFIKVDDLLRIDTRTGEYIERVTKS